MIKPNELRVGNWCLDLDSKPYKIASGSDIDYPWNPIPLTEEILLKAGFKKGKYNAGHSTGFSVQTNNGSLVLLIGSILPYPMSWKMPAFIGNVNIASVQSLHQLQNLYFSLTGEELTINL